MHRLQRLEQQEGWFAQAQAPSFLSLVLDPLTPFVFVRPCGDDADATLAAMEDRLAAAAEMTPEEFESLRAELLEREAWMTGEAPISAELVRSNPYGAGYALARQWQAGVDPAKRDAAMKALDLGSLDSARRRIFDPSKYARVIVTPVPAPVAPPSDTP
ncbi:MAG: hypothetical protein FJ253_11245 [Phycisphaerae bacterium]|nr:hypothetical protein [Phycisphaerae bacterium]